MFNDRAVTARVPYTDGPPRDLESSTIASAQRCGWIWQVPLYQRLGAGYVYSSRFVSDVEAEEEFRTYLGRPDVETNPVRFRTGYYRNQWVKNCVAIGLSGGFIEPLEATGIALITHALGRLLEQFPSSDFPEHLTREFNRNMAASYEWVRDFIVMHYCLSRRNDTAYWRAAREPAAIPESLKHRLEMFHHHWPSGQALEPKLGYRLPVVSEACVLAGLRQLPRLPHPQAAALPRSHRAKLLAQAGARCEKVTSVCPSHSQYLRWLNQAVHVAN